MESKFKKLGSSLQVPDVQELAKEKSSTIPPRYQRPNQDHIISSLPENRIPVIDMQKLMEKDSMDTELQKLHTACQEWGFFQLINHGVSFPKVEKMKLEIQEFFRLPIEEKKKFGQESGDLEGYGQAFVVSEEQKLDWADLFFAITLPIHLRKPHLIPKLPTKFSIEHRATVNSKKERLSIATFFNPNIDGDFGPAPSLVTPETPAKFKRISFVDFMKGYFSRELDGKSYLDTMRI
ncbi:Hypothetical predicted protein [Olea europaea subsp. europaea]|uniref:Non-haem dioxygenase N-terminal domain-containing protein n=1 Tax=Olea europaea subsp. europaea TaxID=158383 RepID=A0A8S0VJ79_OLEEU|nr:Hypothetical predicted protein [Olea europaea subsp. europaea]